jgi:esterase/lipase superfamily enzyme
MSIGRPSTVLVLALAFCCCACSRLPQGTLLPVARAETDGTSTVPVLVATTRTRVESDDGSMFGRERADQPSYASIAVSIPPDSSRTVGRVQWPTSSPGDPRVSFVTVTADPVERPAFVGALAAATKKPRAGGKVLVFVHGFNNRFDEAVYRFAQIVHDSGAPGTPVLFSWPSQGSVSLEAYRADAESAAQSRDAFSQVLDAIAATPNVKEVTILCHSMGCFLTFETLRARAVAGRIGAKIKNVLFVAPDLDAESFRAQLREMGSARPRFALFVSQDDAALKLSKSLHGGAIRLGGIDPDQDPYAAEFRREGVELFDLTRLGGSAHSRAFDDVTSVMNMIQARLVSERQVTDGGSPASVARR